MIWCELVSCGVWSLWLDFQSHTFYNVVHVCYFVLSILGYSWNDVWFFGVIFLLLLLALPFAQFPVFISDNRSGSHCIFNIFIFTLVMTLHVSQLLSIWWFSLFSNFILIWNYHVELFLNNSLRVPQYFFIILLGIIYCIRLFSFFSHNCSCQTYFHDGLC